MKLKTKTKTQLKIAEKLLVRKILNFDMGEKGTLRDIDAALQLVNLNPKLVREIRKDYRYFSIELIGA
jgi:hypothetical protein